MIKELKNLNCEETLRDLDLISMQKAPEGRQHSVPGLKGHLQRKGSLFTRSHAEKTKATSQVALGEAFYRKTIIHWNNCLRRCYKNSPFPQKVGADEIFRSLPTQATL